jgi:hypothetical protein
MQTRAVLAKNSSLWVVSECARKSDASTSQSEGSKPGNKEVSKHPWSGGGLQDLNRLATSRKQVRKDDSDLLNDADHDPQKFPNRDRDSEPHVE